MPFRKPSHLEYPAYPPITETLNQENAEVTDELTENGIQDSGAKKRALSPQELDEKSEGKRERLEEEGLVKVEAA